MRHTSHRRFARIAARAGTGGTLEDWGVRDLKAFIETDDPEALEVAREFVDYVRANSSAKRPAGEIEAGTAPAAQIEVELETPRDEAREPALPKPAAPPAPPAEVPPAEAPPAVEESAFEKELRESEARRQARLDEGVRWRPRGERDPYYWDGDDDAGAGYGRVIVDYDPLADDEE